MKKEGVEIIEADDVVIEDVKSVPKAEIVNVRFSGLSILLVICGILSSLICIIAGLSMTSIRSVAGNTVAEAYYNSVGVFVIGIGLFVGPLLWGIAYLIERR